MEKQTQVREIVTNTNRSINYMPQPSDGAPCVVTLIPGDGIGPLVIGAVERRRMLRESWRNRFGTMRLRLSWRSSTFGEKRTQSLIYKPISSPLPPSDPPADLADLAAVRATSRSRRYQTHSPILPPSDPPTNLAAIRPIWWSRRCQTHPLISSPSDPFTDLWSFTSLFLSIYLSLSLSHDQCLYLRKIDFFIFYFYFFIVDLVYIFRFPIIIFVWKLRKCVF